MRPRGCGSGSSPRDEGSRLGSKADPLGSNWYDNTRIDRKYTAPEFTARFVVAPIHLRYFQDSAHPHLEVRKQISDRCPVWVEFDVSKSDDD